MNAERKIKAMLKVIDTCDYRIHESCGRYCAYWGMCVAPLEDFLEWIIEEANQEEIEEIEKLDAKQYINWLNELHKENK